MKKVGNWYFEIVEVRGRKVCEYGKPFSATATITVVDGEAHVEGLIAREHITSEDVKVLADYLKEQGYLYYICSHFENNERVIRKVPLL